MANGFDATAILDCIERCRQTTARYDAPVAGVPEYGLQPADYQRCLEGCGGLPPGSTGQDLGWTDRALLGVGQGIEGLGQWVAASAQTLESHARIDLVLVALVLGALLLLRTR